MHFPMSAAKSHVNSVADLLRLCGFFDQQRFDVLLRWDSVRTVTQTVGTARLDRVAKQSGLQDQRSGLRRLRDTPTLLTLQSNVLAALLLVWAVSTIGTIASLRVSVTNARQAAEQVSQVQETSIRLTRADSLATSGFLNGGLQSDAALAEFARDIRDASANLAVIYRGPGGQETAGVDLSKDESARRAGWAIKSINEYQADVTSAQANNRQGFPVGATYQKTASNLMRSDILGPLDQVGVDARLRLSSNTNKFTSAALLPTWFIIFAAIPIVLGLIGLSRRTQRTLNLPVVIGLGLAFVAMIVAANMSTSTTTNATDYLRGNFRTRDLITQSRVALYNAKANEALTLIARGSGQGYEQQWRQNMADFEARSLRDQMPETLAYIATHQQVRKLDDAGNWDAARLLVLPERNTDTSNPRFAALDARLNEELKAVPPQTDELATGRLFVAQILVGLAALVAAGLVRLGYGQRIREYQ
jgi:hypothetical protein